MVKVYVLEEMALNDESGFTDPDAATIGVYNTMAGALEAAARRFSTEFKSFWEGTEPEDVPDEPPLVWAAHKDSYSGDCTATHEWDDCNSVHYFITSHELPTINQP